MVFAIHWHESVMSVRVSLHPEAPSHFPLHPIPLGCPRAQTLNALLDTWNLNWSSITHMVIYMIQCYSLKSSNPHLLPHSPKVCSLHLCLFYCLTYRVIVQFSSVQLLSRVRHLATPWIAARQASLSITKPQSLLKPVSIESGMPSSHLILSHPLLLLPPVPPSIRVFSNESTLPMRWPKYWSFSFCISPSNEHPGLISFRMDWLDLLAFQGTLKSLLQHHLQKHQFFGTQPSSPTNSHIHTRLLEKP